MWTLGTVPLEWQTATQPEKGGLSTIGSGRVVKEYLGVLFKSELKMELDIDRQIGAVSAVMQMLRQSIVAKRELSQKAKL